jgi:hypothetical protein
MLDRLTFLIGAGGLLTASFIRKAGALAQPRANASGAMRVARPWGRQELAFQPTPAARNAQTPRGHL